MRLGVGLGLLSGGGSPQDLKAQAAWTHVFEGGVAMLPASPGNFASWADQVGALSIIPADVGHSQTTTDPSIHFSNDATQRNRVAAALTAGTDFGFYVRAKTAGGATWIPAGFDRNGAGVSYAFIQLNTASVSCEAYDGTLNPTIAGNVTVGTVYHDLFLERTGALFTLTFDASVIGTTSNACNVSINTNLSIGNIVTNGGAGYLPNTGDVRAVGWKSGAAFTAPEKAAVLAYSAAHP